MATHLQELAERLADRFGRSVAIDDARLHLLAHSPHLGDVDPARAESILRRAVPREIVDHVYACRDDASGRYLVTPLPDLGLRDARIGYPILHQGSLLGFVWLLGSEGDVDHDLNEAAEHTAAQAAILIHREHLDTGSLRGREGELVGRLLDESASSAERAVVAAAIRDDGLFTARAYSVIAAEIERPGERLTEEDQLSLVSGVAAARTRRLPHDVLALERPGRVMVIVAEPTGIEGAAIADLGSTLRTAVLSKSDAPNCWVGISRSRDDLADASRSASEATRAARVSRRVQTLGAVTPVDTLGVYELLDQVPDDALRAMMHPGLLTLLEQSPRNDAFVQTLETFLDSAGDVRSASAQLFAHRTSLYYRLRRIQELTGLDLSSGEDRLIAHLGLRIARLTGI